MSQTKNNSIDGFSLLELLMVIVVIGLIASIAIPNLMSSRRAANEASAISSIRVIFAAQATYRTSSGNGTYADNLADLANSGIAGSLLACPADPCEKSGYSFSIDRDNGNPGVTPPFWNVYAAPISPTGVARTGSVSFYTNEVGAIYYADGGTPPTTGLSSTVRTPTNGIPAGS